METADRFRGWFRMQPALNELTGVRTAGLSVDDVSGPASKRTGWISNGGKAAVE